MKRKIGIAIEASIAAGKEILKIYNENFKVELKRNNSPVTAADKKANLIIGSYLQKIGIPIISEESKPTKFSERKHWKQCWIIDPLDGTKEFIKRNGEFTVNIALLENNMPTFGVIYAPVQRNLYYSHVPTGKAYKTWLNVDHEIDGVLFDSKDEIFPSTITKKIIKVIGSRTHMNKRTTEFIEKLKTQYGQIKIVSKGSSLKFCLIAEGKANIYPRFAPTMEWDTAAGDAICAGVGLSVISSKTNQALTYNKENLLNDSFVVKNHGG